MWHSKYLIVVFYVVTKPEKMRIMLFLELEGNIRSLDRYMPISHPNQAHVV